MGETVMLNKAIEIAARAHTGQLDKAGEHYILHPLRVMLACKTELEMICAVLHDLIEDTDITLDDLRKEGFNEETVEIVDTLSRRDGEKYTDFIGRILENETACRIKLADLADNMNMARLPKPGEKDKRMEKYKKADKQIREKLGQYKKQRNKK
jgi:(p)ppGpp synthase/HD superfamily hydrolase